MKAHATIGLVILLTLGLGLEAANVVAGVSDPTQPAAWSKPSVKRVSTRGSLVLQATLISPSRRLAIISGRTYGLGARVGNAVITGIETHEVMLTRAGHKTSLRCFPKLFVKRNGAN